MSTHTIRSSDTCTRTAPGLVLVALALLLTACGGADDDSADIDPGSGQSPDAVAIDFPIAYIKGPLPEDEADPRRMLASQPGSDLWLRDRASPTSAERNLTLALTDGRGEVRDVAVAYDGRKLLFALRKPLLENADEADQPTWNIYEYELAGQVLRRVIASDTVAEDGHDLAPHYLPDGRIVFVSTRQRLARATLLDEGKPQFAAQDEDRAEPAFVLHVMDADGGNIRQISFNQSHDLDPSVMDDGRIVFSRWDNASGMDAIALYRVNPDGSGLELLYGADSHAAVDGAAQVQFLDPKPMPDGRMLSILRPYVGTEQGGGLYAIEVANYVNDTQPTRASAGATGGPAQRPATVNAVRIDAGPSPGGRYAAAYPVRDGTNRLLVSWTQCRLLEGTRIVPCTEERVTAPGAIPAAPLYGLWIYDPRDRTQQPIVAPLEGTVISGVVALQAQALPAVVLDRLPATGLETQLVNEDAGVLDIRSVYDINGLDTAPGGLRALADPRVTRAAQRPARFLRIEKAVGLPDDDVLEIPGSAFGVSALHGMREIVGYAMVEPDGSVRVKVPANVPLAITVLDANGRRIGARHRNWLQAGRGETLRCNGCHDPATPTSHGRSDLHPSVNAGATTTGQPFPNTTPALFADFGETMAQTRSRISCQTDCAALTPSVDVVFEDVWTDAAAAGRAPDASFAYRYSGLTTVSPAGEGCELVWHSRCRSVIHYERHLHPLWAKSRPVLDADGVTVLADHGCTNCHSPRAADNLLRVPAGQLDLSDGPSEVAGQMSAYRELLAGDNEQELVMGALQDRQVQTGVDPVTGQPRFSAVFVPPAMSSAGARASVRFFTRFDTGGSHAGRLDAAELRLVSEWLDLGAQYFNDPFAVPVE